MSLLSNDFSFCIVLDDTVLQDRIPFEAFYCALPQCISQVTEMVYRYSHKENMNRASSQASSLNLPSQIFRYQLQAWVNNILRT